eukprot:GFYU01002544.1.p1 GENE.GFYU01002544.1~~GFYU01002544.1.p1  ORF type:complete len:319 (+),score=35.54 GFYU01002544.1:167-1123(+)
MTATFDSPAPSPHTPGFRMSRACSESPLPQLRTPVSTPLHRRLSQPTYFKPTKPVVPDFDVTTNLLELPEDALIEILSHCSTRDKITAKRTCKQMQEISNDKFIWQVLDLSDSGHKVSSEQIAACIEEHSGYRVHSLILKGCSNVTNENLKAALEKFPLLTTLDLTGCNRITSNDLTNIAEYCPKLKSLSIANCQHITKIEPTVSGLKELESLNLSGCMLLEEVHTVATCCPKIKDLRVRSCSRVSLDSWEKLSLSCTTLAVLDIRKVRMNASQLRRMLWTFARNCNSLVELYLPMSLRMWSNSSYHKSLPHLKISYE